MTRSKKLLCDVCGKRFETLGTNTETYPDWWVCLKCFEKADALAAKEDRWPDARDFKQLKILPPD